MTVIGTLAQNFVILYVNFQITILSNLMVTMVI